MQYGYVSGILALVLFSCVQNGNTDSGPSSETAASATSSAGSTSTSADESTGSHVPAEQLLCDRADECNLMAMGVSVQDCVDLQTMCTDELLTSQKTDWENLLGDCLELANCMNYSSCVLELPDCPPRDAFGTDTTSCDPTCEYCWVGAPEENMCPEEWNGGGDGCDCGCQFVDLDC
jgi:hypothetical protein